MRIIFTHGTEQTYRRRTGDITIRGLLEDAAHPVSASDFALNGGAARGLYVEATSDDGVDWMTGYKPSPAELRCRDQGEFCIEIAADDPALATGRNTLDLHIADANGKAARASMCFDWNPRAPSLPVDLRDLSGFRHVQELGQAVNGAFDIDRDLNVIRSRAPVAPDALLLVGAPGGSQEATYAVKFLDFRGAKWLGCGDFYAGMVEGAPPRGIKVGWSSAGMAALSPTDGARSFIAWGDHSGDEREWAIATNPAQPIKVRNNTLYRVRHRISMHNGEHRVRWRLWPAGESEPSDWLCDEDTGRLPAHLPRHESATFGLFQHFGLPIEWSDILIREVEDGPDDLPCLDRQRSREPFLKRVRPGPF